MQEEPGVIGKKNVLQYLIRHLHAYFQFSSISLISRNFFLIPEIGLCHVLVHWDSQTRFFPSLPKEAVREVGGGFRMGDMCTLMADSCQCMAKATTIL